MPIQIGVQRHARADGAIVPYTRIHYFLIFSICVRVDKVQGPGGFTQRELYRGNRHAGRDIAYTLEEANKAGGGNPLPALFDKPTFVLQVTRHRPDG